MIAAGSRAALALALPGLSVFVPERIEAPALYAVEGDPFLEQGDTFAGWLASFTVVAVVGWGDNSVMTAALDALVDTTLDALDTEGWETTAGRYETMTAGDNQPFLVCRITAQMTFRPL